MTEERILDFLDGNLEASEEEELLHRLAVSPERRNLLKQHLQMRELTASLARRQFVPVPKMVTASLFTTLASNGYAGPNIPSELNQKESLIASLERNLDKSAEKIVASKTAPVFRRSSLLAASVISFIMGAAVLYFLMPESRQEKFAASVSNLFQGESKTAIAASLPLNSSMVSLPEHQNNSVTNNTSVIRKENTAANIKNSVENVSLIPKTENDKIKDDFSDSKAENIPVFATVDSKTPSEIALSQDIHGTGMTAKNPFDAISNNDKEDRSFWHRFAFSIRGGEGKAPGNQQALTGSLLELKASYDIGEWLLAKVSIGQFLPYETEAVAAQPGFNNDGIPLFQLSPVLKYRYIAGAEIGAKFAMFNAPFEISGGFISDLQGNIIPRGGLFTSLMLQDNINMNIGLEGMIYTHNISSSIRNAQTTFAGEHPLFIGSLQQKESTGFIGPAIELVWHL